MPLPTPQTFLSTLLTTLPPPTATTTSFTSPPLPPTSRTPLLTLHALFPTLLLPALDLLDRRLLTRFIPEDPPEPSKQPKAEATTSNTTTSTANPNTNPPQSQSHSVNPTNKNNRQGANKPRTRIIYYALSTTTTTTHSSRPSHSRRPHAVDTTPHYEIRPHGWSCTCPAFAFAAYNNNNPTSPSSQPPWSSPLIYDEDEEKCSPSPSTGPDSEHVHVNEDVEDDDAEMLDVPEEAIRIMGDEHWWGGLMRGEKGGGEVPLCKHLLASLLAERWDVVGGLVEEREVGREEMAGWAAGWGG